MTLLAKAKPNKTVMGLLCGVALATGIVGAALIMRGPDPHLVPILPMTAVALQDGRSLNVQTHEVTVSQWQECHRAGYCTLDLAAFTQDVDYPATGLSFVDAMQFVDWVNTVDFVTWRLPTAAEWHELAAEVMPRKPDPIFTDPSLTWASQYLTDENRSGRALRPSGAFSATSQGIQDLDGSVWEWTQDCYAGSSGQGKALDINRCPAFVMGGEHEAVMSYLIRDPARGGCAVGTPPAHLGMRLVSGDFASDAAKSDI